MLVGTHSKMLDRLTGIPLPPQQYGSRTGGCTQSQLIKRECLSTRVQDALLGTSGESEGGNGEFWELDETNVVCDSADDDDSLFFRVARKNLFCNARKRDWGTVDLGHVQSFEDHLVKRCIGASGKESVELDEQKQVWILRLGSRSCTLFDVMFDDIDTH